MASKYDLSLFEERKKAKSSAEKDPREIRAEARRKKWQRAINAGATVFLAVLVLSVFVMMLSSRAKLTELDGEISEKQEELHKLEEDYKSLSNDLAAKTTASSVEEYASEKLHMQAADASQIEYVTVGDGDSGSATGATGDSWLQGAAAAISNFFSQIAYLFS